MGLMSFGGVTSEWDIGIGNVCTTACICVRFFNVDSLRVGCAVSPEGCSPCLWGSGSPH